MMEAQKDVLSADTLAAIRWLGMPEGTPFPLPESKAAFLLEPRSADLTQVELLPGEIRLWDNAMHAWTQARCAFRERSWGIVSSLYVDHIAWAHQTGQPFAAERETFAAILMSIGFQIADGMCYGLILAEDYEAARHIREPPKASPARNH